MAARTVLQAGGVKVGRGEVLFRAVGPNGPFSSAKDGKRFLTVDRDGSEQEFPMVVIENYAARLQ